MKETDLVRSKLRGFTGTFTCEDFTGVKSITSVITKMYRKNEIERVGTTPSKFNRPIYVYKVCTLAPIKPPPRPKPIGMRKRKPVTEKLYATLWKDVYPEYFREPDFSGYRSVTRSNILEWQDEHLR